MSNPLEFASSMEPPVPRGNPEFPDAEELAQEREFADETYLPDEEQPETQGEEPVDAELGENGQGDIGGDVDPDLGLESSPSDFQEGTG